MSRLLEESCTCRRNCVLVLDNGKLANQKKKTIYVRGKAVTLIFWKKEKSLLIADVFMCWVLYKVLHFEGKEEKTLPCNNQVSNSPLKQVFGGLEYRK